MQYRRFVLYIGLFMLFFLFGCGAREIRSEKEEQSYSDEVVEEEAASPETEKVAAVDPESTEDPKELQITVLDVGQGLSVLLQAGGEYAIYDGGGRQRSSYVVSYLKQHAISEIKYLFVSHYDEDHIAGLIGVLNTVPVKEAILPDYQADTAIYHSFMTAVEEADVVRYASAGTVYQLGDAKLSILYASDGTEEKENDRSTVLAVTEGDFSCMLTGDAESDTEMKLMQEGILPACAVYIVGHHGASSSSSQEFVTAISPEVSIISVGEGNDYGHPADETIQTLEEIGSAIYRTDLQGEIRIITDGCEYEVDAESRKDTASEIEAVPDRTSDVEEAEGTYVLNNRSGKFHNPDCRSVRQMADHNKEISHESREELLSQGYAPCGWCKP